MVNLNVSGVGSTFAPKVVLNESRRQERARRIQPSIGSCPGESGRRLELLGGAKRAKAAVPTSERMPRRSPREPSTYRPASRRHAGDRRRWRRPFLEQRGSPPRQMTLTTYRRLSGGQPARSCGRRGVHEASRRSPLTISRKSGGAPSPPGAAAAEGWVLGTPFGAGPRPGPRAPARTRARQTPRRVNPAHERNPSSGRILRRHIARTDGGISAIDRTAKTRPSLAVDRGGNAGGDRKRQRRRTRSELGGGVAQRREHVSAIGATVGQGRPQHRDLPSGNEKAARARKISTNRPARAQVCFSSTKPRASACEEEERARLWLGDT